MTAPSFTFKVVVGGAGGVGKTTLLHRYLYNAFKADTKLTVGVDFLSKEIIRNGTRIMLSLWDLGGQDRFRFVQPSYCNGGRAAIVFFDMTRLDSLMQVKEWVAMLRTHASPNCPIILGGTKLDLVDPETQDDLTEIANNLVEELGLSYYITTSSKTGENVEEIFNQIVDNLVSTSSRSISPVSTSIE
jgi:small GTP-binding protein